MPLERLPTQKQVDEIVLRIFATTGGTIHGGLPLDVLMEEQGWDQHTAMDITNYLVDETGLIDVVVKCHLSLTYDGIRRAEALLDGAPEWRGNLVRLSTGAVKTIGGLGAAELVKKAIEVLLPGPG